MSRRTGTLAIVVGWICGTAVMIGCTAAPDAGANTGASAAASAAARALPADFRRVSGSGQSEVLVTTSSEPSTVGALRAALQSLGSYFDGALRPSHAVASVDDRSAQTSFTAAKAGQPV